MLRYSRLRSLVCEHPRPFSPCATHGWPTRRSVENPVSIRCPAIALASAAGLASVPRTPSAGPITKPPQKLRGAARPHLLCQACSASRVVGTASGQICISLSTTQRGVERCRLQTDPLPGKAPILAEVGLTRVCRSLALCQYSRVRSRGFSIDVSRSLTHAFRMFKKNCLRAPCWGPFPTVPPPAKGSKSSVAQGAAIGVDTDETQQVFEGCPVHFFSNPPETEWASRVINHKFIIPLLFWMVQKELFSHTLRCTNKLILFLTNLNDSFDSAILWTDHKKHPLMLWVSFKESGIILIIYALRDPGIVTFAIINFFTDKSGYTLSAI